MQFIHIQHAVVYVTGKYDSINKGKVFMSLPQKPSIVCYGGASVLALQEQQFLNLPQGGAPTQGMKYLCCPQCDTHTDTLFTVT